MSEFKSDYCVYFFYIMHIYITQPQGTIEYKIPFKFFLRPTVQTIIEWIC